MVMKYVKDFEFPSDKGFTGSAGKMPMRGVGAVTNAEAAQADGAAYLMGRDKLRGMGAVTNAEAAQVRRKKLVGAQSLADLKALGAAKAAARMSPAERNQIDAAMANRAMTGVLGKGYGAMTNAERFLSGREKLRGVGAVTNAEAEGDYAKGGYAKGGAPKGLSVMIAVGPKRPAPSSKKSMSPMMALPMGLKKGGDVKSKVGVVMKEFGKGDLHSGSSKGPLVKNPKQAMAIALSEARDAGAKTPVKKAMGGMMHGGMMHDGYAKGGKPRC